MVRISKIDLYLTRVGTVTSGLSRCILSTHDLENMDLPRKIHQKIDAMQRVCNKRYDLRLPANADIIAGHFNQIVYRIQDGLSPFDNLQLGIIFRSDIVEDED